MTKTDRLVAIHLEDNEFFDYIDGRQTTQSERAWFDSIMIPAILDNKKYPAFWIGIDQQRELIVCEFCFKEQPDERGVVEIGYHTIPAFRNMGYMTEMVDIMVGVSREIMEIYELRAFVDEANEWSVKVMERNNFVKQAGVIWRKHLKNGMGK